MLNLIHCLWLSQSHAFSTKIDCETWKSKICYQYIDFGKFGVDSELLYYSGCCNSQVVTQTHWELCLIYERFPLCAQPYPISIIPPNLIHCSGWYIKPPLEQSFIYERFASANYIFIWYTILALLSNTSGKAKNVRFWLAWPKEEVGHSRSYLILFYHHMRKPGGTSRSQAR